MSLPKIHRYNQRFSFIPLHRNVFILLAVFMVSACGVPIKLAGDSENKLYKSSFLPPDGMARLYVLPIRKYNFILGRDLEMGGRVEADLPIGKPVVLGEATSKRFVAFDTKPGIVNIHYRPYDGNLTDKAEPLTLSPNQTLVLQPVGSGSGAMFGLVGMAIASVVNANDANFNRVDLSFLPNLLNEKDLTELSPEAKKYFIQYDK